MMRKTALATILLGASLMFGAKPNIVHDAEDFEQPGVIQFQGLTQQDEVRVDGELVPAKGLARSNYSLMVAAGEYVVSVKLAGSSKECVSAVKVESGENARPACLRQPASSFAD